MPDPKTLHLTLRRKWFDAIRSGKKTEEHRQVKYFWVQRLKNRKYDEIRFVNGYGKHRPFMRVECLGIDRKSLNDKDTFIIKLGKILEVGNV